jgi:hypothetical protein
MADRVESCGHPLAKLWAIQKANEEAERNWLKELREKDLIRAKDGAIQRNKNLLWNRQSK